MTNATSARRAQAGSRICDGMAAAAAVAVVALTLVIQVVTKTPPDQTAEVAAPAATDASAYERGLKFHLASTEQQLAGLDSADPEERARLIETIVAQNRIYALAAERAGEPQLARVLRAFAPILESLAHEGGDSSASVAQLSFELRVMQGRLSAGAGIIQHPIHHVIARGNSHVILIRTLLVALLMVGTAFAQTPEETPTGSGTRARRATRSSRSRHWKA